MAIKYKSFQIGTRTENEFLKRKMVFDSSLCAPYWVLAKLLGEPHVEAASHDMITSWKLQSDSEHDFFEVRDASEIPEDGDHKGPPENWYPKEVISGKVSSNPLHVWRVLSTDQTSGEEFCRWLSEKVIQEVKGSVKTLSTEEKNRLNQLLASGVTLEKAMSSIKLEQMDTAQVYKWPIKEKI